MHKIYGKIFSGFYRKPVWISESVWTTCCEINDFEPHIFPIVQKSGWRWSRVWGRWCGQGCRWEGGEGVSDISVKIKLTAFYMHLTLFNQVQVDVHVNFCYLSVNGVEDLSECTYFMFYLNWKINPFSQYTCTMNECFTHAISWHFSVSRSSRARRLEVRRRREAELSVTYVIL